MQSASTGSSRVPEREPRYLELLVRVSEILSSEIEWERTLAGVRNAAVETVADICVLGLADPEFHVAAAAHRDPQLMPQLEDIGNFLRGPRSAVHPLVAVMQTRKPLLVPAIDDEYLRLHSTSREHEAYMRRMGYRSLLVVPLISVNQGVIGALQLIRTDPEQPNYDESALRFAQDVGRQCANAIDKSRLYEQTLRIATLYQQAALPAWLPEREGVTFDAIYEPSSQELLVGGDWYDAFDLPDGRIAITVGDVLGHGLDAAIWMSRLRNGLRAALFAQSDPVRALEIGETLLRAEVREEFVTALVALVDPVHQTLSCASAGHPGPLLWQGGDEIVDPIKERGVPLGLRELGPISSTQIVSLRQGSFLTFFTDGLLEWNHNIDEAWSQLEQALRRPEVRESEHPARSIRDAVIRGPRHEDDVAILTMRWRRSNKSYGEVRTLSGSMPKGSSIKAVPSISAVTQPTNDEV